LLSALNEAASLWRFLRLIGSRTLSPGRMIHDQ
jgi:hypothetical protein